MSATAPTAAKATKAKAGGAPLEPAASVQDWIAVLAGSLGALIASLDISITNSALPQIQGEVGASGTEGTWIATGYLVSEVVMIPLTAWLTRVFGLRNLLLSCAILFTAFSILCGFSHDLTSMIIGRVGQGFFGGALIPTAQTIVRTRLPMRQIPIGMTMFGLIVLLGPLVGPVIGGWLTENASWQWCFFLNIPVAGALVTLLLLGLPYEKSHMDRFLKADWLGIIGMTVGLSCLTIVLEEGQRERWFESHLIVELAIACVLGMTTLAIAQFTAKQPVIKLRLMANRSYGAVILIVTVVGAGLYGVLYILPQFLSGISGYNAQQSGQVLFLSGIPAFAMMPFLPTLLGKVNLRLLIFLGLGCFSASCFMDVHLTAQSAGGDFVISQLLRGMGQILCLMPLNQTSVGSVSREDAGDAAGLYNMARNLGGSIGLALLGVFIDRRMENHADAIGAAVTNNSQLAQSRLDASAAAFTAQGGDPAYAHMQAMGQLAGVVHQQAQVISYSECFFVLGVAMILMMPLLLLLRPPKRGGPVAEAH